MAEFLKGLLLSVLSEKCYDEYFNNHNFLDAACFKSSLSKGLGIGIIAGSILVKVPQILKILGSKSAEGININAVCLELFAITANFAYSFNSGFPFSSWGEGTFLAIQTSIIAALVLQYGGSPSKAVVFLAIYVGLVAALVSGQVPIDILWNMQAMTVPVVFIAKSIQFITNYRNGSTGQLSAITCLLLFGGSIARIFTSIQETGDPILIVTYLVSTAVNGAIVLQLFWYWNVDKTKAGSRSASCNRNRADTVTRS